MNNNNDNEEYISLRKRAPYANDSVLHCEDNACSDNFSFSTVEWGMDHETSWLLHLRCKVCKKQWKICATCNNFKVRIISKRQLSNHSNTYHKLLKSKKRIRDEKENNTQHDSNEFMNINDADSSPNVCNELPNPKQTAPYLTLLPNIDKNLPENQKIPKYDDNIPNYDLDVVINDYVYINDDDSTPNLDATLPNINIKSPNVNIKQPNLDTTLPNINIKSPNVNIKQPNLDVKIPNNDLVLVNNLIKKLTNSYFFKF